MPGLIINPLATSSPSAFTRRKVAAFESFANSKDFIIRTFRSAISIPTDVWTCFESSSKNANVMYPHALERLADEYDGRLPTGDEFWMVYWSNQPEPTIDFVLSCTNGPLGTYPIFIFTPHSHARLHDDFLRPRITRLVRTLDQQVPHRRVYSVFAAEPVAKTFAKLWTAQTGISTEKVPYYAALITYCTRMTLLDREMSIHPDQTYEIRPAVEADIPAAAELCYGFASESVRLDFCAVLQGGFY